MQKVQVVAMDNFSDADDSNGRLHGSSGRGRGGLGSGLSVRDTSNRNLQRKMSPILAESKHGNGAMFLSRLDDDDGTRINNVPVLLANPASMSFRQ
jgi:hypothetical protein